MSDFEKLQYAKARLNLARAMGHESEVERWREHVAYWESRIKKCSICGKWVDSFNGVIQYDDNTSVFICDCCFLQTESGQELLG